MSISGALRSCAAGLALLLVDAPSALTQTVSDAEWTVLTVAFNSAWGLSTARSQGAAIASAVRQCQSRSADESDCGAELIASRIGWGLAILCGDHRVLVSGGNLEEAETAADQRLAALKQSYGSGLPTCLRLLTINPVGGITTDDPQRVRRRQVDAR